MLWNSHSDLRGLHAFLAPSNYHWVNYDDEKFEKHLVTSQAARLGDQLHEFASSAIKLRQKLPPVKKTMNMFVNDAIGFHMTSELTLFYSENVFGTTDAISFREGLLRIHDLKTGSTRTNMTQLIIYAALFCLEYEERPNDIQIELRIYKSDDIEIYIPTIPEILEVMDVIVKLDRRIKEFRKEQLA